MSAGTAIFGTHWSGNWISGGKAFTHFGFMSKARILIIPGAASPLSREYTPVYALIENEARCRGGNVRTVVFPGQCVPGTLTFLSAIRSTARLWKDLNPTWVIARSFGCVVLAKLLSDQHLTRSLQGAVLWGPTLSAWVKRFLPTEHDRIQEVEKYRQHGTNLEPRFFDDFPALEILIEKLALDVRLSRGSLDKFNSREDLCYLAAIHQRENPSRTRDVVEIRSLGHSVTSPGKRRRTSVSAYLDALFAPIRH